MMKGEKFLLQEFFQFLPHFLLAIEIEYHSCDCYGNEERKFKLKEYSHFSIEMRIEVFFFILLLNLKRILLQELIQFSVENTRERELLSNHILWSLGNMEIQPLSVYFPTMD